MVPAVARRRRPAKPRRVAHPAGKHRAIDHFRRSRRLERKHEELGYELEAAGQRATPDFEAALDDEIGDDLLRLVFTACHPVLSTEARVALTLRLLVGLTTAEIARAFLVSEPTVAQRIVRAKGSSSARRHSRATHASVSSCSSAPAPVRTERRR